MDTIIRRLECPFRERVFHFLVGRDEPGEWAWLTYLPISIGQELTLPILVERVSTTEDGMDRLTRLRGFPADHPFVEKALIMVHFLNFENAKLVLWKP